MNNGLRETFKGEYQYTNTNTRLIHDQCIYMKRDMMAGSVTIKCCYVDDILLMGNNPTEITSAIKHFISQEVTNLTEMGEVEIYRSWYKER